MKKKDLVLMTLSFFEPMTFEKIILDFSKEDLKEVGDFKRDELIEILNILLKEKKIIQIKEGEETFWKKSLPKKSMIRKFLDKIFAN